MVILSVSGSFSLRIYSMHQIEMHNSSVRQQEEEGERKWSVGILGKEERRMMLLAGTTRVYHQ
jgi:hypothetical protein